MDREQWRRAAAEPTERSTYSRIVPAPVLILRTGRTAGREDFDD